MKAFTWINGLCRQFGVWNFYNEEIEFEKSIIITSLGIMGTRLKAARMSCKYATEEFPPPLCGEGTASLTADDEKNPNRAG